MVVCRVYCVSFISKSSTRSLRTSRFVSSYFYLIASSAIAALPYAYACPNSAGFEGDSFEDPAGCVIRSSCIVDSTILASMREVRCWISTISLSSFTVSFFSVSIEAFTQFVHKRNSSLSSIQSILWSSHAKTFVALLFQSVSQFWG